MVDAVQMKANQQEQNLYFRELKCNYNSKHLKLFSICVLSLSISEIFTVQIVYP